MGKKEPVMKVEVYETPDGFSVSYSDESGQYKDADFPGRLSLAEDVKYELLGLVDLFERTDES